MEPKLLSQLQESQARTPRFVAFGGFIYDLKQMRLTRFGKTVHLDDKASELLRLLIEHPCRLMSRPEIHQRLWNGVPWDASANERVARVAGNLKISLGDILCLALYIETIAQEGYALVADIRAADSPERL